MNAAEELNEEISPAEIREMISHCDPDGEGKISLEAFIAFNKRKNFDWMALCSIKYLYTHTIYAGLGHFFL